MSTPKPIRCAIYTRKSTEEGLEQAFNSLDAQREACVAYVASQRHEGWVLCPELYDDGGFSGGNMNRPGLAQLMAEVQAGRIQVIVVYKVDRLTRSLADFAKIVEVLDAQGASFVSVTQSFNTTTSMGRLTLNVLLSFAQFEREVTGERIRDKIAASKRKGMWMGGPVPLGYEVRDRKLVINEAEAATVRLIFDTYLRLGSVIATVEALAALQMKTKVFAAEGKKHRGGVAWTRGGLAHLLVNRVYIGQIRHRDEHFPGEHAAIISSDVWEATQAQLSSHRASRRHDQLLRHANLLGGLLFDGLGRRMKSAQAAKGAKRYHYYQTTVDAVVKTPGPVWRVPAHDAEALVVGCVRGLLGDRIALQDAVTAALKVVKAAAAATATAAQQVVGGLTAGDDEAGVATTTSVLPAKSLEDMFQRAQVLAEALGADPLQLRALVHRIDLHDDRVDVAIDLQPLLAPSHSHDHSHFQDRSNVAEPDQDAAPGFVHHISVPATKLRRGPEVRLIITDVPEHQRQLADPALLRLVATARLASSAMQAAGDVTPSQVAKSLGYTSNYFTLLLRLSTLAPSIVQAIIEGHQPLSLSRQRLARVTNLPIDWNEQRRVLGF